MAYTTSYDGSNSGSQVGQNLGHITNQFLQSETSLDQACLRDLRTTNPHHDKDRIQDTNGGLFKDSYCWILENEEFQQWQDNQSNCLLWIRGDPGKGKTMLLCGIIEELTQSFGETANISFFFCQAADMRINNATAVLRGLIYSLVKKQPSLLSHVKSQYDYAGKALFEDINAWNALSRIFTDILKDPTIQSTYLVIDALDEYVTGLPSLLDLITRISSAYLKVKWIVSSRNWPDIEERLNTTHTAPISLELNEASISKAVSKFIQHKVHDLAKVKTYNDETRDSICCYLLSNSQGTFLWVALVCQELGRTSRWNALKKLEAFPPGLNSLYSRMIDQVRNSEDAEPCKRILATMSIVYRPITFNELVSLVELPDDLSSDSEALSEIIMLCGSFLVIREDTIVFVHQSAKEFLLREIQNGIFARGIEAEHYTIFTRSLHAMFRTLRRDIFQLRFPGFPIEKVVPPSPNPLAAVHYACVYWVDHLYHSGCYKKNDLDVDKRGGIGDFLQKKYLHWLEALSILRSLSQGIAAILKLDRLLQEQGEPPALVCRVQDASRFIRYHRLAIESSPLQVYSSPLIFSPTLSSTRRCYQRERPDWVLSQPLVDKHWSPCLQTLEGHSGPVYSIAWSQDGGQLASASEDNTVRIWDPTTGQCVLTLEEHDESVELIVWSQDGSRLASVSHDMTVKIWNSATGRCTSTLKGHNSWVSSVAWSQDGSRIASASQDMTVRTWDPANGQCLSTLKLHHGSIKSVGRIAWSQDGSQFASESPDKTVRVWDPTTGLCVSSHKGHSGSVRFLAWSQDGKRLASASEDRTIRVWDPPTSRCASILEGHSDWVYSVSWSTNGSRIASASQDMTVKIWDPSTAQCVLSFKGHSEPVCTIAWSQDGNRLASGSLDTSVRIWDPATSHYESSSERHNDSILSMTWSQDGTRLASASGDGTVKIWDSATGQCKSTLTEHSGQVRSIAWSQNGSRLASGSIDQTVKIWDLSTTQCVLTLRGYNGPIHSISWSPDGSQLASATNDKRIRIWNLATRKIASILTGHNGEVLSTTWSQDGNSLASASVDKTLKIWDSALGHCKSTLKGHSHSVGSIVWSPDKRWLASASFDETIKIWDLATEDCKSTLQISSPYSLRFDQVNTDHLQTRMGSIKLESTGPPQPCGYGLSDDHSWITINGANLLWLPMEYRPSSPYLFAISSTTIAIGCSSGRVMFLAFTNDSSIVSR
ncbi:hypothetical protein N7501_007536 [Penicillium viridicatum]|nr:hypothetical protein N7501_007536 [Penicillium viridicatum]